MARQYVEIELQADGQQLTATQLPPALASGVVYVLRFRVALGAGWAGFDDYSVLMKNGAVKCACPVVDGIAIASSEAMTAGQLEIALMAQKGARRLTTQRLIIKVYDSGL